MSQKLEEYQKLMAGMRTEFLEEIDERCGHFERLLFDLQKSSDNQEAFEELFRLVHSLKGTAGSHGVPLLSALSHQLEDLLVKGNIMQSYDEAFIMKALILVDTMREVQQRELQSNASNETDMGNQSNIIQQKKSILLAESSKLMAHLCNHILPVSTLNISIVSDGLTALQRLLHEHFDLAIIAHELSTLNGTALISSLRKSDSCNANIPILIISGQGEPIGTAFPEEKVLLFDKNLADNLSQSINEMIFAV